MPIRTVLAAGLLLAAASVHADPLPRPAEFYFDADAGATRPVVVVRETGDAAVAKLLKAIERDPRAIAERAQLAHVAMAGGRTDLGRQLYAAALAQLAVNHGLWRPVVWNYAWDLYRTGDAEGALAQWQALVTARGTTAGWMPPTLALALWTLGRKDEAVQWYAAAVRTEPKQWSGTEQFAALLPDWSEAERATLAQVHQAWAANPPRWP